MITEKTIYTCDRCGEEINKTFFEFGNGIFRKTISAAEFEVEKYACLNDDAAAKLASLPEAGVIVLEGMCGYLHNKVAQIHLCKKCSKAFRSFMKSGDEKE